MKKTRARPNTSGCPKTLMQCEILFFAGLDMLTCFQQTLRKGAKRKKSPVGALGPLDPQFGLSTG